MKTIGKLKIKPSSEIKQSRIGIGFECLDRDLFDPEKCYDLFAATGAKFARCQTGWAKTEKQKGVYDWKWLDDIVDNLLARGVTPWFNVGYGNPIYMPDCNNPTAVGFPPTNYGKDVVEAWVNFVTELAHHFKGRVTHYEIWNEPDQNGFWQPALPSGEKYGELVVLTGNAIKSVNPNAKIGACAATVKPSFLDALLKTVTPEGLDFFCSHTYSSSTEIGSDNLNYPKIYRQFQFRSICTKPNCGWANVGTPLGIPWGTGLAPRAVEASTGKRFGNCGAPCTISVAACA